MKDLNIAILHGDFNTFGGAERIIFQLIENLHSKNYNLTVITYSITKPLKEKLIVLSCNVIELKIPIININDTKIGSLKFLGWKLKTIFDNYDVINVHNFPATLWLGFASKFNSKLLKKVIWSCHEPPRFLYENTTESKKISYLQYLDKKTISKFQKIICNSSYTAKKVKEYYNIDSIVKHFGIVTPKNPIKITKSKTETSFGIVSRLEPIKNISFLLECISEFIINYPNSKITVEIVGTGSEETHLKTLTTNLNLTNVVTFKGFISDTHLIQYYKKWHAILFCPFKEPMGLIPLEAACFNTPTIGSNMGGLLETIQHNKTGILVSPTNKKELISALVKICNDKEFANKLGENANKLVLEKFNFKETVSAFEKEFLNAYEFFKKI